jgi:carotenoid cleavage dioxygenase-like enzyme
VTYGTCHEADDSHAFVLDARTMREVARLRLPQRIPLGFHSYFCHDHT